MLPTPISLEENEVVTMAATIRGPPSSYGCEGKESVEVDGVIVTFSNGPSGLENGTDVNAGQFYEILVSMEGLR